MRTETPQRVSGAFLVLVVAALGASLGGAEKLAPQERCSFVEGSGNLRTIDFGGNPITYVSTPNLVCRDGVRIRADSAVAYQASNYVQLIGTVHFEDPERRMSAASAEYFTTVGRLQGHGGIRVEQKADGGTIRGEEMIYLRAGPERAHDQLDVFGGRPTARLYVRPRASPDSVRGPAAVAAAPPDPQPDRAPVPYDVEANRILIEGDSYFRAVGRVQITREEEISAFGDSVEYDQIAGTLRLTDEARVIMDDRELTASVIQIWLPGEVVSEVVAREHVVLATADVRLEAPLVRVFFTDGVMERLVATPMAAERGSPRGPLPSPSQADSTRPRARAEAFTIVADSLDVLTPGEILERIHAAGDARAESSARDSLNTADTPAIARTDWMEGDTIVARFARVDAAAAAADTAVAQDEHRLERLAAMGSARSLYRIVPNDSARGRGDRRPAIHYVTAAEIVIELDDGVIERMQVSGQTVGVHAEPAGASAAAPVADSAAADTLPADTLPADTLPADALSADALSADTLSTDTLSPDILPADPMPPDRRLPSPPYRSVRAEPGSRRGDRP